MKALKQLSLMALLGMAAVACNTSNTHQGAPGTDSSANVSTAPAGDAATALTANNNIEFTGNDQMAYSDTVFKVEASKPVTIKFTNAGSMPKEAMGHNVVVLKAGTDLVKFATAAQSASSSEYIPDANKGDILAHTKLLGPKETDEITFTLPKAGTYQFLCTFPGHYGTMRGHIVAE